MLTLKTPIVTVAFGLACFAASSVMAPAQAQKPIHFIMCGGEVREADQAAIDEFKAENPDVEVNMEAVPWGTCQDKSLTLAAAGDPPSVSYMGSRTLKQLASNGLIVPVSFSADEEASFQPGILNTVSSGGEYWGIPHAFSTKALYMNCDVIEAAGQACEGPETWDELYALAKAVKDSDTGAAGIGLAGKDFDNTMHQFLNYLYSNGGKVLDADSGEVLIDSKETVETLAFYGKLAEVSQDGPTAWERDQLKDLFNDGKIAMYINGPWGRGNHNEDIRTKTVQIPGGPSGEAGTILITDSLAVFNGSGHEEMALKLAKKLASTDFQYLLDRDWGLTPIRQYSEAEVGEQPYYIDDPFWQVYVAGIYTGGPEPLVTDFKSLQSVFTNMIQGVLLRDEDDDLEALSAELVKIAAEELEEIK